MGPLGEAPVPDIPPHAQWPWAWLHPGDAGAVRRGADGLVQRKAVGVLPHLLVDFGQQFILFGEVGGAGELFHRLVRIAVRKSVEVAARTGAEDLRDTADAHPRADPTEQRRVVAA